MKEAAFISSKLKKDLNKPGTFWYKPPDVGFLAAQSRFSIKRPFDIFFGRKGKMFAIEAKVCKALTFNIKALADHQHKALQAYIDSGNEAFVAIYFERLKDYGIIEYRILKTQQAWKIDVLMDIESSAYVKGGGDNL